MKTILLALAIQLLPFTAFASEPVLTDLDCERAGGWAYSPKSEEQVRMCIDGKLDGQGLSLSEVCPEGGVTADECSEAGGYAYSVRGSEDQSRFCVDGILSLCGIKD